MNYGNAPTTILEKWVKNNKFNQNANKINNYNNRRKIRERIEKLRSNTKDSNYQQKVKNIIDNEQCNDNQNTIEKRSKSSDVSFGLEISNRQYCENCCNIF